MSDGSSNVRKLSSEENKNMESLTTPDYGLTLIVLVITVMDILIFFFFFFLYLLGKIRLKHSMRTIGR